MEFSSGRAKREVFSAGLEATALRQARMPAATARDSESDFGVRVNDKTRCPTRLRADFVILVFWRYALSAETGDTH